MKHQQSIPPRISVCVPMYNVAPYIRECLDSILSQSFTDFELILADDGSTDGSAEIVAAYPDPRIRLFRREHDYIATSNFLLDAARGRYIARMDADDVMCPDRLQFQYDYLETHPDVDIVGGAMNFIGLENKRFLGGKGFELSLENILDGNGMNHPTAMMRTARIRQAGLRYRYDCLYAEDYAMWVDALLAGLRIISLPQAFINYRVRTSQVSCIHYEEQARAARLVRRRIVEAIACRRSVGKGDDASAILPPRHGAKLTVIVPFLNEGEEVKNTLASIRRYAGDRVEIIAINDNSTDDYDYNAAVCPYRVSYVVNSVRMGVAASRDKGVALCRTPYFLLLDAHMRFYDDRWPERLVSLLEKDDRVLLCCQTKVLRMVSGEAVVDSSAATPYGAVSAFRRDAFWPDIEWSTRELMPGSDVEPIPGVLGAGYAASRRYWQYLKGLEGLKSYGSDEAFISFKVWREGGRCLLVKDVAIGHIYRPSSPFKRYAAEEVYNNLLISSLVFSQSWRCHSFAAAAIKDRNLYTSALAYLSAESEQVSSLKSYLEGIFTIPFDDVLKLHKSKLELSAVASEQVRQLDEVNRFIIEHRAPTFGLYAGLTGQFLWFMLYRKHSGDAALSAHIEALDNDIRQAVREGTLSWNFADGLCGIGWAYIFLYTSGLIESYPESLLSDIDSQLSETTILASAHGAMDHGLEGLLPYAALRLKTGCPKWNPSTTTLITDVAQRAAARAESMASVFYGLLCLDVMKHGVEPENFQPRISDWMKRGQHLPKNPKHWKPTLVDGCIGAVISFLQTESYAQAK